MDCFKYITIDSLMSSSSKASSVFSWGQNRLREKEEQTREDVQWQQLHFGSQVSYFPLYSHLSRSQKAVITYFSPEYTRGRRLRM